MQDTDYMILAAGTMEDYDKGMEEIVSKVKSSIRQGWEPLGGISVIELGETVTFSQAMIKKDYAGLGKLAAEIGKPR